MSDELKKWLDSNQRRIKEKVEKKIVETYVDLVNRGVEHSSFAFTGPYNEALKLFLSESDLFTKEVRSWGLDEKALLNIKAYLINAIPKEVDNIIASCAKNYPEYLSIKIEREKEIQTLTDIIASNIYISHNMNTIHIRNSVFVIHGRSRKTNELFFNILEQLGVKVNYFDEMRSKTSKGSPYINEILDKAFTESEGYIVLLTPDDRVKLRKELVTEEDDKTEGTLSYQPRPNVLYEAGMAMRQNPQKTIFVQIGRMKVFSDISGIHLIRFDGTNNSFKNLTSSLKSIGLSLKNIPLEDISYILDEIKLIVRSTITSNYKG